MSIEFFSKQNQFAEPTSAIADISAASKTTFLSPSLFSLIDRLAEPHSYMMRLKYVHSVPEEDIATAIGISVPDVYSELDVARLEIFNMLFKC